MIFPPQIKSLLKHWLPCVRIPYSTWASSPLHPFPVIQVQRAPMSAQSIHPSTPSTGANTHRGKKTSSPLPQLKLLPHPTAFVPLYLPKCYFRFSSGAGTSTVFHLVTPLRTKGTGRQRPGEAVGTGRLSIAIDSSWSHYLIFFLMCKQRLGPRVLDSHLSCVTINRPFILRFRFPCVVKENDGDCKCPRFRLGPDFRSPGFADLCE